MDLAHAGNRPAPANTWEPLGVDLPGFTALFDYWQSVRRGKAIPRSSDFDLLALTNWLPEMALLDVRGLDEVNWRFAGTAIVERMGTDPSGENVFSVQAEALRARSARAYRTATRQPCGALAYYTNHYSSGREGNVRTLYLPLETPSGECRRLVSLSARDEAATFAEPIERTMVATKIISIDWIDIGFGLPTKDD